MTTQSTSQTTDRQAAMAVLAIATSAELSDGVAHFPGAQSAADLKSPEVGLVMLRGRIRGDGAAFNVGEATVARAVVRLAEGTTGYNARLGRDVIAARHAAILDALWQSPGSRADVEMLVLKPIRARAATEQARKASAIAASRVEFFTMARENT